FFFQAEDGIRDGHVTGVQTCALPISICARSHRNHCANRSDSLLRRRSCFTTRFSTISNLAGWMRRRKTFAKQREPPMHTTLLWPSRRATKPSFAIKAVFSLADSHSALPSRVPF